MQAAAGDLDPAFGSGGKVTTNFFGSPATFGISDEIFAVALQSDGKIVAAGYAANPATGSGYGMARYNPDGTLDASFGMGGKVAISFFIGSVQSFGLVIQNDGRIVLAGTAFGNGTSDFCLARYNSDGSEDATFGSDGRVTTDFFGDTDAALDMAIQPDGRIIAAGVTLRNQGKDFAVARYNADGSLDPSFGQGGKVSTDISGLDDTGVSEKC